MSDYKELRIGIRADNSKFETDMKNSVSNIRSAVEKPATLNVNSNFNGFEQGLMKTKNDIASIAALTAASFYGSFSGISRALSPVFLNMGKVAAQNFSKEFTSTLRSSNFSNLYNSLSQFNVNNTANKNITGNVRDYRLEKTRSKFAPDTVYGIKPVTPDSKLFEPGKKLFIRDLETPGKVELDFVNYRTPASHKKRKVDIDPSKRKWDYLTDDQSKYNESYTFDGKEDKKYKKYYENLRDLEKQKEHDMLMHDAKRRGYNDQAWTGDEYSPLLFPDNPTLSSVETVRNLNNNKSKLKNKNGVNEGLFVDFANEYNNDPISDLNNELLKLEEKELRKQKSINNQRKKNYREAFPMETSFDFHSSDFARNRWYKNSGIGPPESVNENWAQKQIRGIRENQTFTNHLKEYTVGHGGDGVYQKVKNSFTNLGGELLGLAKSAISAKGAMLALGGTGYLIYKFASELNSATKSAKSLSTSTSLFMGSKVTAGYMDLDESKFFQAYSRMGMSFADPKLSKIYSGIGLSQGAMGESDSMVALYKMYERMREMPKSEALYTSKKIFGHSRAIGMEMVRASEYLDEFLEGLNVQSENLNKISEYSVDAERFNDNLTTITNSIKLFVEKFIIPSVRFFNQGYKDIGRVGVKLGIFDGARPLKDIETLSAEGKASDMMSRVNDTGSQNSALWKPKKPGFLEKNMYWFLGQDADENYYSKLDTSKFKMVSDYFKRESKLITESGNFFDVINEDSPLAAIDKSGFLNKNVKSDYVNKLKKAADNIASLGLPIEESAKLYEKISELYKNIGKVENVQKISEKYLSYEKLLNFKFEEAIGNNPSKFEYTRTTEYFQKMNSKDLSTPFKVYRDMINKMDMDVESGMYDINMIDESGNIKKGIPKYIINDMKKKLADRSFSDVMKELTKTLNGSADNFIDFIDSIKIWERVGVEINENTFQKLKNNKFKELFKPIIDDINTLGGDSFVNFRNGMDDFQSKLSEVVKLSEKYPELVKNLNINIEKTREQLLYSNFGFLKPGQYDKANELKSLNQLANTGTISESEYGIGKKNILGDVLTSQYNDSSYISGMKDLDYLRKDGKISDTDYNKEKSFRNNNLMGEMFGGEGFSIAKEIKSKLKDLDYMYNGNIPGNVKNQAIYGDIYKSGDESMKQLGQNYKDLMSEGYSDGSGFTDMGQVGTSMSRYGAKMDMELKNLAEQQLDVLRGIYEQIAQRNYNMRLA